MQSLFSLDSPIMRCMSRVADLVILNLLLLLTSLPILTIGPSLAAMYTVLFRLGTPKEQGLLRSYFRAFAENFWQSLVLWLLVVVCIGITGVDIWVLYRLSSPLRYLYLAAGALMVVFLLAGSYVFPLISQFRAGNLATLKNALVLSIGYLPRSLAIVALHLLPLGMLLLAPYLFLQIGFLWIFFYFAGAGYLTRLLLKKVFQPYLPEESEPSQ